VSLNVEETVKFWKTYTSGSRCRNLFEGFFNFARWGIVPQFGSCLWKSGLFFMKILPEMYFEQGSEVR